MPDTVAVTLPAMGESVTEGTVVEWRKAEGDAVQEGEVVADVTTDKVDVEVTAPASGVLQRIVVAAGASAAVGATLAEIAPGNGAAPSAAEAAGAQAPETAPATAQATPEPGEAAGAVAPPSDAGNGATAPPAASPPPASARRSRGQAAAAPAETVDGTLPAMGESVTEGVVSRWLRHEGDRVTAGEPIVEVTTDKVDAEVPAPVSGTLAEVLAAEGATVEIGGLLGRIAAGEAGASKPDGDAPAPASAAEAPAAPAPAAAQAGPGGDDAGAPSYGGTGTTAPERPDVEASPLARRAAALAGVDLAAVRGSGPGGLVRSGDVGAAARGGAAPAPASAATAASLPESPPEGSTPLRGPAAALAGFMEQSREIPTATSFRTIAVDVLDARRRELNAAIRAAGRQEKVSFTHLIGYAVALAALDVPSMATSFLRTRDGGAWRVSPGVHLGLAVDTTRKDGSRFLVVPVIKDAAGRDFASFRDEYERLVAKSRTNSLAVDELRGASIVLTNPGGIGTVASVPRLMQGQGTIVATGAITYPPGMGGVGEARLRDLGVTKVMTMTSTYDHRVIQGAESGEFLGRIEALLGGADRFYARVFEGLGLPAPATEPPAEPRTAEAAAAVRERSTAAGSTHELLAAVSAGMSLVKAFRTHGHLGAHLDPLGTEPISDPSMDPETVGLTPALMEAVPADVLRVYVPGSNLAEVYPRLRDAYCGTIAYQIEHINSHEQRVWLREHIESGHHRHALSPERKLVLLQRLIKVDAMERYLRRTFLGQKTFSIEGLDAMVPMLEELLSLVAADGIGQVIMGMAHRGRLATIAHVANRPYDAILVAFEHGEQRRLLGEDATDPTGDVKYHYGAIGTYLSETGKPITVRILSNPSHLEVVDPVVEGWTRAEQTRRSASTLHVDPTAALPVLIHGDAAFPGQGVIAEVLNLQSLQGYSTGGTVHVIANNQIGFTTDPAEARSTRYASDLAKGFDTPIIHVNADDVESAIYAMRLAWEYRRTFHRDVVVDLVGYRRFGHNEADEPSYTQPRMYQRIKAHPTVREVYARQLVDEGLITAEDAEARAQQAYERVQAAHQKVKQTLASAASEEPAEGDDRGARDHDVRTAVSAATLVGLNEQLLSFPDRFHVHPKMVKQMERRRADVADGSVDWGTAESLAFASLLLQGRPIRLTGQDTERGTFSHRHLVFHDAETGGEWCPIQHLTGATATFELHNSPLSEEGCLGFEYGYSAAAPDTLVLWEAQFGDFVNGAQVIVDQFISSGQAKWGQRSRLTLLLPHGYEGQGPEHSSARLERFLQLAANGLMRVAYPSTAGQYFHLVRQQALSPRPRPLVVMTPKSLLRLREAAASLDELSTGGFRPVIDDPVMSGRREQVRTLLLCTGKLYWDLQLSRLREQAQKTAIARIEMLDPLPSDDVLQLVKSYPNLEQLFWVQEEPKNMGAWNHLARPLGRNRPYHIRWDYIGRPRRASPSEGFAGAHQLEQERIVTEALTIESTSTEEALAAARSGGSTS